MNVQITKVAFVRIGLHRIQSNLVRSFVTCEPKLVKWSSGQVDDDEDVRKKKRANNVKRINWENYNLFGPLLQSAIDRQKEQTSGREETHETVIVKVKEAGYKNLNGPPIIRTTVLKRKLLKKDRASHGFDIGVTSPLSISGDTLNEREEKTKTVAIEPLRETVTSFPLSFSNENSALDRLTRYWTDSPLRESNPSVSTVLQRTMPAASLAALERWEKQMILKLGEEGFQKYKQETFAVGSNFHRCIQDHLSGKDLSSADIEENVRGHWKSLNPVLSHVSDVSLIETKVRHPFLHYTGILDCVARYRGTTVLIEWKTSQRPKSSLADTFDIPLQAVAYLGALSFQKDLALKVDRAALVIAYSSGSPAHVHYLNEELCQRYWTLWLKRLYAYYEQTNA